MKSPPNLRQNSLPGMIGTLPFIKSDYQNGKDMWLIYAADGTKLATTDNRDYAFIVAKQNNLTPRSVH